MAINQVSQEKSGFCYQSGKRSDIGADGKPIDKSYLETGLSESQQKEFYQTMLLERKEKLSGHL